MATSRTTIIRGPGTVMLGTTQLFDAGGITAEIDSATQDVPSSISGKLDTIKTDQIGKITFTPCGQVSAEILTALFPHQTPAVGSSLCGVADVPVIVHSLAGTKITFSNGFLSKIPDLILSPIKTAFGSAEITALLGLGKAPADAGALYAIATAAYAGYPDPTGLTGAVYAGTYGALSIPDTLDGWTVSFDLSLSPVTVDSIGTVDYTLGDLIVRASCTPVGLTETQILSALPVSLSRGASLRGSTDLVIAAPHPGLTVTLKNAAMVTGPLAWGNTTLRAGQLGFIAHRAFTGGVAGALYGVTQTAEL